MKNIREEYNEWVKYLTEDIQPYLHYFHNYIEELENDNSNLTSANKECFKIIQRLEKEKAELISDFNTLYNGCKNIAIRSYCGAVLNKYER